MNEHLAMLVIFAPAIVMVIGCMIEASRDRFRCEPTEPLSPRRTADSAGVSCERALPHASKESAA